MQNRPNVSLLKNTYLDTYRAMETCLMKYNFSLLFSRKIENQVFDMMITAQKQKVPTKKLECNKDLNKFCSKLMYDYNISVSVMQQFMEGLFTFSLLISFFSLLDIFFERGILISTVMTCTVLFSGYFISKTVLRYRENTNAKLRSLLVFVLVLLPFVLMTYLKTKVASLVAILPLTSSLLLVVSACIICVISYLILSKKYDLFIFVKNK